MVFNKGIAEMIRERRQELWHLISLVLEHISFPSSARTRSVSSEELDEDEHEEPAMELRDRFSVSLSR